jgi:tetratricopeptide (TPR) repeat protein
MSKKLSKEDLEQDLLIEYSSRILHFYNTNKAAVWGGGIAIVLTIGLTIAYVIHSSQQEDTARELLSIAEQEFLQGNYETALDGSEADFTLGFNQIAANYENTTAGNLASYYAAASYFELGDYATALQYIEMYDVPSGVIGVSPISLHASILSELERYEEAASMFERAANWDVNESTTPLNLFSAAEAYREAGMNAEAERTIDTILEEYPNTPVAVRAERLKGLLAAAE